jgi:hypothetical protein
MVNKVNDKMVKVGISCEARLNPIELLPMVKILVDRLRGKSVESLISQTGPADWPQPGRACGPLDCLQTHR